MSDYFPFSMNVNFLFKPVNSDFKEQTYNI